MADPKDNAQDEKYKGTGSYVSAVGRSTVEANIGSLAGAVVGGGVGAAVGHRKGAQWIEKIAAKGTRSSETIMDMVEGLRNAGHKNPEAALATRAAALAMAVVTSVVVGTIASMHGYYKGAKTAAEGKAQFEALQKDVRELKGKQAIMETAAQGQGAARG